MLRCQIEKFIEYKSSLSSQNYKFHNLVQCLSDKLFILKYKKEMEYTQQRKAFKEIQTFFNVSCRDQNFHQEFNLFCDKLTKDDGTWAF